MDDNECQGLRIEILVYFNSNFSYILTISDNFIINRIKLVTDTFCLIYPQKMLQRELFITELQLSCCLQAFSLVLQF